MGAEQDFGPDVVVFHAGTSRDPDGTLRAAGGRVLNVCARSRGLSQALKKAREACEKIHFDGRHFRRDIGTKAMVLGLKAMPSANFR